MSAAGAFDNIENKHTLYHKEFCTSLREHATNVINFEKKMILGKNRNKQNFSHSDRKKKYKNL